MGPLADKRNSQANCGFLRNMVLRITIPTISDNIVLVYILAANSINLLSLGKSPALLDNLFCAGMQFRLLGFSCP